MRAHLAVLLCLLLLVGPAAADDEKARKEPAKPLTTEQVADKVLEAIKAKDQPALKALAEKDEPDPWFVADELCYRGKHDAAEALARSLPGTDGESLAAHVASRRGHVDDADARRAFVRMEAVRHANRVGEALAMADKLQVSPDSILGIRITRSRAYALRSLGRLEESSAAFLAAADAAEKLGWTYALAIALYDVGVNGSQRKDWPSTLAAWERAAALLEEARGVKPPLRRMLAGIGQIHKWQGAPKKALAYLERAFALAEAETMGNKNEIAQLGALVGDLHRALGASNEALRYFERALALETELGHTARQATVLVDLGRVRATLGDYTEALAHHQRALSLYQEVGNRHGQSVALGNLGAVHRQLGDPVTALSFQERSLALARELGDEFGVAAILVSIGNARFYFGDYVKALREYRRALDAFTKLGHKAGAAGALSSIGNAHEALGDHAKALAHLERALRIFTELGDQDGVANALGNLGNIHNSLGDYERARAYRERALAHYEKTDQKPEVALQLANLGQAFDTVGDYDQALSHFERALAIQREILDKRGMAQLIENIGRVHTHRGDHARALEHLQRALALWEQTKDRANAAITLGLIGETKAHMGERVEGLKLLRRAEREARSRRMRPLLVRCLGALARIHLEGGDVHLALAEAQQALDEVEHLLGRLGEEQGALARERYTEVFELGTVAAARAGDPARAVTFLESGRAGSLLESLGGRTALRWEDLSEGLRQAESVAEAQEARAREAYGKASASGDLRVTREKAKALEAAAGRVTDVAARIQREVKGQAKVFFYPRAATAEAIQERLHAHQALVLYGLCLDEALAVVLTPSDSRVVSLGSAAAVRKACAAMDLTDVDADARVQVAALRKMLVEPLALPKDVTQVLVSPEGPLCYVPFAALFERVVAFTPSGSTHVMLQDVKSDGGRDVLALGDPDYGGVEEGARLVYVRGRTLERLPATRPEAQAVGDHVLLGAKANEGELRSVLGERKRWRAVHFACHGLVDRERPTLSSLALSATAQEDGFLTAIEVLRMHVPADLVVLSACETGRGRIVKGEGIVGLTRAFMYAGAPRVIASLWKVDDEATRALMVKFYELWNPRAKPKALSETQSPSKVEGRSESKGERKGLGAAAALKKAQAFVRSHDKWKHPYYWAAWVLWGLPE